MALVVELLGVLSLACCRQPFPSVSLCILSALVLLVLGNLLPLTNEVSTNLRLLGLQLSFCTSIKGVATLAVC